MPLSIPFLAHAVIEAVACVAFFTAPELQLGLAATAPRITLANSPHVRFLTIQYAALLLSSCFTALIFVFPPAAASSSSSSLSSDDVLGSATRVWAAGALAVYHYAPLGRAAWRCSNGEWRTHNAGGVKTWPVVHLLTHALVLLGLLGVWAGVCV
ncbi:hypothetical protein BDZ88DRAFT_451730 [Geranomyces variabilis]|nr:hypothetical protein BDZ88DRAFT_451730 [Geranomyces variabilis]